MDNKVVELVKDNKEKDYLKIKKHDRCCIIGFAPSWDEAPFEDKDVDFWGINELYIYLKEAKIQAPFAAWFEIHDIRNSPSKQAPAHQAFLKNCRIPLITQQHWEEYPASIPYPRQVVKDMVNESFMINDTLTGYSDYSNQISWMIALALLLDYKEIMVYGVDMAQQTEYAFQKASCHFFIGYCAGRKVLLRVPKSCELLKGGADYGFKTDNVNRFRAKSKIKSNNFAIQQLSIRQAEIEYIKKDLEQKLKENLAVLTVKTEEAKARLNDLGLNVTISTEIIKFLTTMPDDLKAIQEKKEYLISANTKVEENNKAEIEALTKIVNNCIKEAEKLKRDFNINVILLDKDSDRNKQIMAEYSGGNKENEHNLNNNLV